MIAIPDMLNKTKRLIKISAQPEWYDGTRPPTIKNPSGNFLYTMRLAVPNAAIVPNIIAFLCIFHR